MVRNFEEAFWGTEFTSYHGFETLCKRMKEAKQMLDDFTAFARARAKIEDDYGKALLKLVKTAGGLHEIGTLKEAWDKMKTETENTGHNHVRLGKIISDEIDKPTKDFRERQRDQRKKTEDTVKKAQKFKSGAYERNTKCKRTYDTKCREADKLDEDVAKGAALSPKDFDKLKGKATKARSAAEQADAQYQQAVKQLDEARVLWEQEMERCCQQYQIMEEERIAYLRNTMWFFTNTLSETAVRDDDSCENVRLQLERCNVDADIEEFVNMKMTGSERPAPIEYQSYYFPSSTPSSALPTAGPPISSPQIVSMSAPIPTGSTPAGIALSTASSTSSLDRTSTPGTPVTASAVQRRVQPAIAEVGDDSASAGNSEAGGDGDSFQGSTGEVGESGSAGGGAEAPPNDGHMYVRAAFDYEAQGPQELTLHVGDFVRVVSKDDDLWWCGEKDGHTGMFPTSYVVDASTEA